MKDNLSEIILFREEKLDGVTESFNKILMGEKCHICSDPAYDDCFSCHLPTCKKHGKLVGDYFVCKKCSDKFR
jgi:hypothetical protein